MFWCFPCASVLFFSYFIFGADVSFFLAFIEVIFLDFLVERLGFLGIQPVGRVRGACCRCGGRSVGSLGWIPGRIGF